MAKIDHKAWMEQPRMLNERCRGLPLIWTPDVKWFNNDWLGPTPHVHDEATEIGFLAQGSRCRSRKKVSCRAARNGIERIEDAAAYAATQFSGISPWAKRNRRSAASSAKTPWA